MHAQHYYWWAGGAALAVMVLAGVADWRRSHRKHINEFGWMPWRGIQVTALFVAILVLIVALKMR